jgi:hypothetical protein
MVAVFPEPAPAMTSRGDKGEEIIRDCSGVGLFFSPSIEDNSSGLNLGSGRAAGSSAGRSAGAASAVIR